jgi:CubicO group peptidase (beta-lactamase class C family)
MTAPVDKTIRETVQEDTKLNSKLTGKLPRAKAENAAAVAKFLAAIKTGRHELHSFILVQGGAVRYEAWWAPYAPELRHKLYSLSKSFVSLAVGIAIDEGLLSLDTLIADIFAAELAKLGGAVPERAKRMTVRHLLTMTTGQTAENWQTADKPLNNIEGFLTADIPNEPGGTFFYNTLATYMLSAAITRLTGLTLERWLAPRLFEPMELDAYWEDDPRTGVSLGGVGLNLTTEALAKLGELLLRRGEWNGKSLVPGWYIDEATSKRVDSVHVEHAAEWESGYGYQFWRCPPEGVFRADGAFGQFVVVEPGTETVVAITGNVDMGGVMRLIWRLLEDLKTPCADAAPPPAPRGYLTTETEAYPGFRAEYDVTLTGFSRYGFTRVSFDFSVPGECLFIAYDGARAELSLLLRQGEWTRTAAAYISDHMFGATGGSFGRAYVCGEWRGGGFTVKLWFCETPSRDEWRFDFSGDAVEISYSGFTPETRFAPCGAGRRR